MAEEREEKGAAKSAVFIHQRNFYTRNMTERKQGEWKDEAQLLLALHNVK